MKYTHQITIQVKKYLRLFVFALCLFISSGIFAQKIVFTVMALKGYAKLDDVSLKIGAKLKNNQTLKIDTDTYLCLVTTDQQVLEITTAGTYVVKELMSKVPPRKGLNASYVEFVVSEVTKATEDGISAKNRFQHMNKTGAVKRSMNEVVSFFLSSIKADNGHILYGDILDLAWEVKQPTGFDTIRRFQVSVLHLNGMSVFSKVVGSPEISIDLSKVNLKNQDGFTVQVVPLDNKGKYWSKNDIYKLYINLLDASQKQQISEKISAGSTAIDKLMNAQYFESEKLFPDAIHAYKDAIRLSEGNPIYEDLFYRFWLRNMK
ncbi:MAG: hypothetical protein EAZ08_00900 [Cytophagales bacterium]|nr:MAG: hypothetical protein EAZ08_00900 [Cytophagales bacterium]